MITRTNFARTYGHMVVHMVRITICKNTIAFSLTLLQNLLSFEIGGGGGQKGSVVGALPFLPPFWLRPWMKGLLAFYRKFLENSKRSALIFLEISKISAQAQITTMLHIESKNCCAPADSNWCRRVPSQARYLWVRDGNGPGRPWAGPENSGPRALRAETGLMFFI